MKKMLLSLVALSALAIASAPAHAEVVKKSVHVTPHGNVVKKKVMIKGHGADKHVVVKKKVIKH